MFRLRHTILILIAALSLALSSCAPPEPVRIGFLGGLSGWSPELGIDGLHGARLAVELRNKAGGIKGRQIELIEADDQQDTETARQSIARLIEHKVAAVVGPMTSAMAMATVPLSNQAQLLMVSPTATSNDLSGQDDYFFRVVPATRQYVKTSADFYYSVWGLRKLRLVYDLRNRSYTESWLRDFSSVFAKAGGELLEPINFTSSDEVVFSSLARQALSENPDGIIIIANSVDTAMLCESIRKLNSSIAIGAAEWASTGRLIELGGKSVEGIAVEHFFDQQSTQPNYIAFRDAYAKRFGQAPGFGGLYTFDATNVILDAMEKKTPDQSLKQTLLAQKTFAGTQRPVTFDAMGDSEGGSFIFIVKDGAFDPVRTAP